ncbi:hypothetical protein TNCV_5075471 [Trichonephila clavipes]|uniref:Uncharacterized protein n=1 Tax=Trichonephila clavipes TaxID=2585209 RepID=A0A8X6RY60_TRICX|nr:hypothetical protein TNCV_5075471 [Trichonephila clavipes]
MARASFTAVVSSSFERHTGDSRIWIGYTSILRGNTLEGRVQGSHLYSPFTNLSKGLAVQRIFRVPPSRTGTIHLRTFMPSPGIKLRPYGRAVSVTNHYIAS